MVDEENNGMWQTEVCPYFVRQIFDTEARRGRAMTQIGNSET
jgi:hypothetical protein